MGAEHSSLALLADRLRTQEPTLQVIQSTSRHFQARVIREAFSERDVVRGSGVGRLFEGLVYEQAIHLLEDPSRTRRVVAKWKDVPFRNRKPPRLGQNGFFYTVNGEITVRGNGFDLAEIDLLILDEKEDVAFVECVQSGNNLKGMDREIRYKKRLLSYIFDNDKVIFILACPSDISKHSIVKRILRVPFNSYVTIPWLAQAISRLKANRGSSYPEKVQRSGTIVLAQDLNQTKDFDYGKLHDECRTLFLDAATSAEKIQALFDKEWGSPLVKHILLGQLDNFSLESVLTNWNFFFSGIDVEPSKVSREQFVNFFSKAVLALALPELRPTLYLRSSRGPLFFKMGPTFDHTFRFERNIRSNNVFFQWLETSHEVVGIHQTSVILDTCVRSGVLTSRRKRGDRPDPLLLWNDHSNEPRPP